MLGVDKQIQEVKVPLKMPPFLHVYIAPFFWELGGELFEMSHLTQLTHKTCTTLKNKHPTQSLTTSVAMIKKT